MCSSTCSERVFKIRHSVPLLSSHCYYTPVALGSLCLPECGMDSICLSCAVPYVKCHVYVLGGSNIPSSGRAYSDVHII